MSRLATWALVVAIIATFSTTGATAPKRLKLTKSWMGSVDDVSLMKLAPRSGVIADPKLFAKIWKAWGRNGEAPKIDFSKHLVLVATTRGSRLGLNPTVDDRGDLRVIAFATRDFRPGFRYVLAVVGREGIKTVRGKPLPKP